jgi:hypothetical protein
VTGMKRAVIVQKIVLTFVVRRTDRGGDEREIEREVLTNK